MKRSNVIHLIHINALRIFQSDWMGGRYFFGAPSAENFSDFGAPSGHFGAPKWPKKGSKFFAAPSVPRKTP